MSQSSLSPFNSAERCERLYEILRELYKEYDLETRSDDRLRIKYRIERVNAEIKQIQLASESLSTNTDINREKNEHLRRLLLMSNFSQLEREIKTLESNNQLCDYGKLIKCIYLVYRLSTKQVVDYDYYIIAAQRLIDNSCSLNESEHKALALRLKIIILLDYVRAQPNLKDMVIINQIKIFNLNEKDAELLSLLKVHSPILKDLLGLDYV